MFVRVLLIAFAITALAWTVHVRASESAGRPGHYVVQPGDTLWAIAADRYAGDPREGVWELQRVNRLNGTAILPGQRLVLP